MASLASPPRRLVSVSEETLVSSQDLGYTRSGAIMAKQTQRYAEQAPSLKVNLGQEVVGRTLLRED